MLKALMDFTKGTVSASPRYVWIKYVQSRNVNGHPLDLGEAGGQWRGKAAGCSG